MTELKMDQTGKEEPPGQVSFSKTPTGENELGAEMNRLIHLLEFLGFHMQPFACIQNVHNKTSLHPYPRQDTSNLLHCFLY